MNALLRRGVCPGLSAPLPTGDGLLVRMRPIGPMTLAAFDGLCTLAAAHGSGIIEITARGSIQVRGLTAASAPRLAAAVAALGIAAQDGVAVLTNPLAGIAEEIVDLTALAADLRRTIAHRGLAVRLSPKISVVLDGGGTPALDALTADVRLRAARWQDDAVLAVSVGGDAASAVRLGYVAVTDGVETAVRLLEVLAKRGRNARARDILMAEGVGPFHSAVADLLLCNVTPQIEARRIDPLGVHGLRNGSSAYGIGLAFGHADASSLRGLIQIADRAGVSALVPALSRSLIAVGLSSSHAASQFAAQAERLGFIVRADDPRRRVVACAGAPFCASGHIATRALAPLIAEAVAPFHDGLATIHLSGCAKGCAHPQQAALTIVGLPAGCALVADGAARDAPFAVVATEALPAAVAKYARARPGEVRHV
jgi:precorrin-3B synthase